MTAYRFYTADVFTERVFGGNPVAVFPDARGLNGVRMQEITREFGLSETVFLLPPQHARHTRRARIFTPGTELSFAGHPTIGAAHVLAWSGELALAEGGVRLVLEEGVGPVPVTVRSREGRPSFAELQAAKLPEPGPETPPADRLAAVLSLTAADLVAAERPRAVSAGVPYLFVSLTDRDALRRARLDPVEWQRVLASFWAPHVFAFTYDTGSEAHVRARMFAPALGIEEDPATGAAALALADLLVRREGMREGTRRWAVEQGFEMGRPSRLEVEADVEDGRIAALRLGGAAVLVSEGAMHVPAGEPA